MLSRVAGRIVILEGKPHGPDSVIPAVVAELRRCGVSAAVRTMPTGRAGNPAEVLAGVDVVGLRHLSRRQLGDLAGLGSVTTFCNSVEATATARDKAATYAGLVAGRLPLPATVIARSWAEVRALGGQPLIVKQFYGSGGSGVLPAPDGSVPVQAPFAGPYLVQELIRGDGIDRKIYVVGGNTAGVLRRWPPIGLHGRLGTAFTPTPDLAEIARATGAVLGLEVFGVDLVVSTAGPMVVDVNAFPGFKGVPGAARWIARHLVSRVRQDRSAAG